MIVRLIMFLVRYELKKLRRRVNDPYLFITSTTPGNCEHLMYTDDVLISRKMHNIY